MSAQELRAVLLYRRWPLCRHDLPLWAVLALNLAEFAWQPAPAGFQSVFLGTPSHEVCEGAEERTVRAAGAAASASEVTLQGKLANVLGVELDDAFVGFLAGFPGWLLAGAQFLKECGRRRRRRLPRKALVVSNDESDVQTAREVARALRR